MPRLKNKASGAVVNVSDDTAKRLGADWEPADAAPKSRPRKPADKSDD
ncbi:DUF7302 family protein [Microbacterium sp. NPDC055599]